MHRTLSPLIRDVTRQYGNTALRPLSALPSQAERVIPTGLPELDAATGIGGIPKGRIVEIYGPAGTGKTALALQIVRQLQRQGVPSLYADAEHALSPMMLQGVDMLYALNVDTIEDALQACIYAAPAFGAVIIDTLPAMHTRESLQLPIGETEIRPLAKVLAQYLPRLFSPLSASGCTLIILNQTRERQALFHNPETVPGGRALRHYAALRLEVRCVQYLQKRGQRVRVRVIKNKCAASFRTAEAILTYGKGLEP